MKRWKILEQIAQHNPFLLPSGEARRSAVLVPLRPSGDTDELEVVLTRRSADLGSHAGQVAFPGGGVEPGDRDATATALRETREELGVTTDIVDIVGRLDDVVTVTGFHVVQIVGLLPQDVVFAPDPAEVARVFCVPMRVFLDPESWERKRHQWRGNDVLAWHLPYQGEDIWGATAYMLRGLVEMLWGAGHAPQGK